MDYEQYLIRKYKHWGLYLHLEQYPYVGRCYAWALREDADLVEDMTPEEREELFGIILPAWSAAIKKLYNHDRSNLAILGNTSPHLHCHLIPRYKKPQNQYGIEFVDPQPTRNYAPHPKKELAETTLMQIRQDISDAL